ncbi:SpoIIE family protein phosphatase [Streptomyces sp. NPDC001222]|uniref:SpoIIE family protein phosphatase n=1 Tax=Streptomyces sp. NPDC001222 TaxID=3364548 RepID=UPI0036851B17
MALAGHPPPVIARPDGSTEIPHLPSGPPLGSTEGPPRGRHGPRHRQQCPGLLHPIPAVPVRRCPATGTGPH